MSEQTYQWPTAEQTHELFGKHSSDAKTEPIKELLSSAFDDVGSLPEGTYRAMAAHYDDALTSGLCPCGSKATFGGCCKNDWLFVKRGRAKAAEEIRADLKAQHKVDKETEKKEKIEWLVKVGVTKGGRVVIGATDENEGKQFNPSQVLHLLREAGDGLERSLMADDITEMVFERLAQVQSQMQARAQAGPLPGMPLGPDGKPMLKQ